MLMLVPSTHLLSFSPQFLPNRVSRIPYTRRAFKLLQKSVQDSVLLYQSSLERSSQLGNTPSQYEGFKPKSWALCTQPPVLGKWSHGRSFQTQALQLKDNCNYRKYRCSWAGFCSGCYVKAIPRAAHCLHLRKVLPHQTVITHVKPLCLCSTRNQSQINFFPMKPSIISICKIRHQ